MKISIVTLFPEMFDGVFSASIISRAVRSKLVEISLVQLRDFASDARRTVDAPPFGGGAGMVLQAGPLLKAVDTISSKFSERLKPHVILMSPQGMPLTHDKASELSKKRAVTIVCGHYEGVDERFIQLRVDEEISIGDFVVTGGEIPAMALTDSVVRLMPGVLGSTESPRYDSFAPDSDCILEGPAYTRPAEFQGLSVPDILLSGDHAKVNSWRRKMALLRTRQRRPDLLES